MSQGLFELSAEEGERLPIAVHALEDHGCPGAELTEHRPGIDYAGGGLGAGAGRLRVVGGGKAVSIPDQSEGRQAQTLGGDDAIDVVQGEEVVEAPTPFGPPIERPLPPKLFFE